MGRKRQVDGDANTASADHSQSALFLGATMETANRWSLGVTAGFTDSRVDIDQRRSSARIQSLSLALAAGKLFETSWGGLNVLGGIAHTSHELETKRDIAPTGLAQTLEADRKARALDVFGEVGLVLPVNTSLTAEPFLNIGWTQITQSAFQERGGSAALSGARQRTDSTSSTLGLRMQQKLGNGGSIHGSLGWRHASGDVRGAANLSFAGSQPFTVTGAAVARNGAVMQVGAQFNLSPNTSLGLAYGAQFGGGGSDHGGKITFNWRL
ncbi:MAG: autotransporter domain-containing protein [Haliea sp.]|nr:MAG: autotransporter domain-containing protein [Haliea sp.]